MKNLNQLDIIENIKQHILRKICLIYCVGLQILFETSEEDILSKGLGFFKGKVKKFPNSFNKKCLKIPAIGWNKVFFKKIKERF